ncbi:MAG: S-methyl-5'-thioadenosine phosphorylase [Kiritimatiellia bacterium]|jgi:5'-methylthioadenosine phosphorylase|nr:S-methyl-5'-thioadenosine phosphorylase [Kiritimatiellia bacterium]MDP6630053.1 S-methyl-5'-thioadenosine phosphorylase [Kiritimatiellia bacterium]MDP6811394.1 S-methyl-5'-thioadenosine phosphorylase [Kiritimatiellia bacterium]MDP7023810.1 S-methyl-5'-thioadenosine phosphorylase [Kiritimatiellia bacterium]
MKLGVIGGSGVYEIEGLQNVCYEAPDTPFGEPSDQYCCAELNGVELVFLPRHGRQHRIMPSEINHRANIYGFKALGVDCLISISAVGSLKESISPRDIVLPDQYYDRTKKSLEHTFFGNGVVAHVSMADPTCPSLRETMAATARDVIKKEGLPNCVHAGGTYVNMEGPQFSTRAESNVYRSHGFDVIGMTSLGEAKLCREAEICYQPMAMVTDYDCWHEEAGNVTVEMVMGHLVANTQLAKAIVIELAGQVGRERSCSCRSAMESAILTPAAAITDADRERFGLILARHADG